MLKKRILHGKSQMLKRGLFAICHFTFRPPFLSGLSVLAGFAELGLHAPLHFSGRLAPIDADEDSARLPASCGYGDDDLGVSTSRPAGPGGDDFG